MRIELDGHGRYQAVLTGRDSAAASADRVLELCPFADEGPDEDDLGAALYPDLPYDEHLGRHLAERVGHVADRGRRVESSSGGIVTWLLAELLERGRVDAVLHVVPVAPEDSDPRLFRYGVSRTPAEVRAGVKTRYYPVELSEVLAEVRARPGRYAVVGVPCYIKAIRRLQRLDPVVAERVELTVAIFCGHQKTSRFADAFGWPLGVDPGRLRTIDFRHKILERPANRYGVRVEGEGPAGALDLVAPVDRFLGADWGHGMFKYEACDFCDDVVGETADVSCGDAWLPAFVADSEGTSVVVARDAEILELLDTAAAAGELVLDPIAPAAVVESQESGFRHRRRGLAYRLWRRDRSGRWRPRKRVAADRSVLDARGRRTMRLREQLARHSHIAFARALAIGDYPTFVTGMLSLVDRYDAHRFPRRLLRLRRLLSRRRRGALLADPLDPRR